MQYTTETVEGPEKMEEGGGSLCVELIIPSLLSHMPSDLRIPFQIQRGCILAQVLLILLVRPSSHSSIAHFFILEWFIPILTQVLLI